MVAHGLFLTTMAIIGYWQFLGILYYAGLAVAAMLVIYQYQLIEERTREGCFKAFRNNNWVGLRDLGSGSRSTCISASGSRGDPSRRHEVPRSA